MVVLRPVRVHHRVRHTRYRSVAHWSTYLGLPARSDPSRGVPSPSGIHHRHDQSIDLHQCAGRIDPRLPVPWKASAWSCEFEGAVVVTLTKLQISKTVSVQTIYSGTNFMQDQKLAHYMKLPPRQVYLAQVTVASFTCLVQAGVKVWTFSNVPDICQKTQPNFLTCPGSKTLYTSSITWYVHFPLGLCRPLTKAFRGLIGPQRLFSFGAKYHPLLYGALAGALIPIPIWLWVRRWPQSIFRNLNIAVVFSAVQWMPPVTGFNYTSFIAVGFVFNFWIRRRHFGWWSKVCRLWTSVTDVRLMRTVQLRSSPRNGRGHRIVVHRHLFDSRPDESQCFVVGQRRLRKQSVLFEDRRSLLMNG